jgi:hypothetical protein
MVDCEVYNQKHMINIMLRGGYYLCNAKSGFMTNDYIQGIRYGKFHCPKAEEIRLRSCPNPPCKTEIVEALLLEARNFYQDGVPRPLNLGFD